MLMAINVLSKKEQCNQDNSSDDFWIVFWSGEDVPDDFRELDYLESRGDELLAAMRNLPQQRESTLSQALP